MPGLSYDRVVEELGTIVAEVGPDYKYTRQGEEGEEACLYVHHGAGPDGSDVPGCLIGVWLWRFRGYSLTTLADHENNGIATLLTQHQAFAALAEVLNDKTRRLLSRVQELQDQGWTWVLTVLNARQSVESLRWDNA
jgi:hypothetical protein